MVKDHSNSEEETRCRHIGYSYRLTASTGVGSGGGGARGACAPHFFDWGGNGMFVHPHF